MRIYEIDSPVPLPIVSPSCYFQRVSYLYEVATGSLTKIQQKLQPRRVQSQLFLNAYSKSPCFVPTSWQIYGKAPFDGLQ